MMLFHTWKTSCKLCNFQDFFRCIIKCWNDRCTDDQVCTTCSYLFGIGKNSLIIHTCEKFMLRTVHVFDIHHKCIYKW